VKSPVSETISDRSIIFCSSRTDPREQFGSIRVLGSGAWILAGLLIGTLRFESTATPMRLAAAAALLMEVYCFTLPDTPLLAKAERLLLDRVFFREALNLLR
jgi:hypothetical protein